MSVDSDSPPASNSGYGPPGEGRQLTFARRFAVGFVAGVALGVLLLGVWLAATGALAARDARDLRASASRIQAGVEAKAYTDAAAQLPQAYRSASALDARLSSVPWSWVKGFPVIGTTVVSAAVMTDAAAGVLQHTQGLEAVLAAVGGTDAAAASASLAQLSQGVADAAVAAQTHLPAIEAIDPSAILPLLGARVAQAQRQLLDVMQPLAEAAPLSQTLPDLFGVNQPAKWLVVLGQPAESRGSAGGFIGAYASLAVADGGFVMEGRATDDALAYVQQDISWLPAEYRRLWGSDATYLWGLNESRHYPYAAETIRRTLDPNADYVLSLTPRAVAGLLAISGPITVEGSTVDTANAEAFFSRDIYIAYPDVAVKDRVTLEFLTELFRMLGSQQLDPKLWWDALSPLYEGQSIQVWAADPAVQAHLEETPLGGVVPNVAGPWVTASFINAAGNKSDSFLQTSLEYRAWGDCEAGEVNGSLTANLTMQPMPPGLPFYISGRIDTTGAPYGSTANLVYLYGPSGSIGVDTVLVNGKPVPATAGMERGHPVWGVKVNLEPGTPASVQMNFRQPPFAGEPLVVESQAMVQDTAVSVVDERTCGVGAG